MIHSACRSCHAPPQPADESGVLNDCAVCHLPDLLSASLTPILPGATVSVSVAFDTSVPADQRSSWRQELLVQLEDCLVTVTPAPGPGSVPVDIAVSIESGEGRTEAGKVFHAARGVARIEIHSYRQELTTPPAVGQGAAEAKSAALKLLARQVADLLGS